MSHVYKSQMKRNDFFVFCIKLNAHNSSYVRMFIRVACAEAVQLWTLSVCRDVCIAWDFNFATKTKDRYNKEAKKKKN